MLQGQKHTEELKWAEALVVLVAVVVKMKNNGELLSEVLDVLIPPSVE